MPGHGGASTLVQREPSSIVESLSAGYIQAQESRNQCRCQPWGSKPSTVSDLRMAVLEELVVQLTGGNGKTSRLLIVVMLAHKLRDLARYRNTDLFPIFGKKVVLRLGSNMNARMRRVQIGPVECLELARSWAGCGGQSEKCPPPTLKNTTTSTSL
jgi:hypothetical protein